MASRTSSSNFKAFSGAMVVMMKNVHSGRKSRSASVPHTHICGIASPMLNFSNIYVLSCWSSSRPDYKDFANFLSIHFWRIFQAHPSHLPRVHCPRNFVRFFTEVYLTKISLTLRHLHPELCELIKRVHPDSVLHSRRSLINAPCRVVKTF
jgi:hypothetical protein